MLKRLLAAFKKMAGSDTPVSEPRWDEKGNLRAEIELEVSVVPDEVDGGFVAECLNFPGCMSQGETIDEAIENISEAIAGVLAVRFERSLRELTAAETGAVEKSDTSRQLTVPLDLGKVRRDRVPA